MLFPYQDPESTTYIPVFPVFGIDVYIYIIYIVPIFSAQPNKWLRCELQRWPREMGMKSAEKKIAWRSRWKMKMAVNQSQTGYQTKLEKTTSRVQADTS